MRERRVATVVNFCTNDIRFIKANLEEAMKFSFQVLVPVCDHFFDGTPEDRGLLNKVYEAFPQCTFVEYPYLKGKLKAINYWHSLSRLIGVKFLDPTVEKVLFLDADEVVDGERFLEWLRFAEDIAVTKLANYWYFRDPIYQSKTFEDSSVLIDKNLLTPQLLFRKEERDALYDSFSGRKKRMAFGLDGTPMVHHYSWVRTHAEMLKKVKSWGHHRDKDWETLVNEEFSRPFNGKDFVHGYTYTPVASRLEENPTFEKKGTAKVLHVTKKEVSRAIKKGKRSFWNLILRKFP